MSIIDKHVNKIRFEGTSLVEKKEGCFVLNAAGNEKANEIFFAILNDEKNSQKPSFDFANGTEVEKCKAKIAERVCEKNITHIRRSEKATQLSSKATQFLYNIQTRFPIYVGTALIQVFKAIGKALILPPSALIRRLTKGSENEKLKNIREKLSDCTLDGLRRDDFAMGLIADGILDCFNPMHEFSRSASATAETIIKGEYHDKHHYQKKLRTGAADMRAEQLRH
jgi:hypothetical protein